MTSRPNWTLSRQAPLFVAAAALAVRLVLLFRTPGGPGGLVGYDSGVYYAASDALLHGRLPYRDFTLLHPPGIMLALTPFVAIGRLVGDHAGFVVADAAFAALGAGNAALVVVAARRLGTSGAAATFAGLAYALWLGSASAEIAIRLEPLGNALLLAGLSCATRPDRARSMSAAGALLTAACLVKIWWAAPALIIAGWALRRAPRQGRIRFGMFAAGAAAVIAAPFAVAAPRAMFRMVVLDQIGRTRVATIPTRLFDLAGLSRLHRGHPPVALVLVAIGAGLALALTRAWRHGHRLTVVLTVGALAILIAGPTYFAYYSDFLAAPLALALAGAVDGVRVRVFGVGLAAVSAIETVAAVVVGLGAPVSMPFPRAALRPAVASARCVISDSPGALIQLDALSRGLSAGCPNWVDVSGRSYDVDASGGLARAHNRRWQRALRHYLRSGDAVVLVRHATGLSAASRRAVEHGCVLGAADGYSVVRTAPDVPAALPESRCRATLSAGARP